ncbi:MAG TPA: DUF3293 domain-containing protein [Myxococcaceae bacterium]|nr:DUF3293 domain-containing protein [Myxococcaceae bacterium]
MGSEEEAWEQYPNTVLELRDPTPWRLDLRRELSEEAMERLRGLGFGKGCAVFTAENPEGRTPDDAAEAEEAERRKDRNARRRQTLREHLTERGIRFVEVDGVAPDGDHRERCVAVALPREQAQTLACEWQQLALFWFDGARFWLLPAELDQPARPLPA